MASSISLLLIVTIALNLMTWPKTIEAWDEHSSAFWAVFVLFGMIAIDIGVIATVALNVQFV